MKVIRRFYPEVRLKQMLAEPGGVKVSEAIARANENVESVRGDCMNAIDAKIEAISVLAGDLNEHNLERAYTLSNEIFAEAGVFGLRELSEVAYNLCRWLAAGESDGLNRDAVKVHVDSMRALRTSAAAGSPELRATVLHELGRLSSKLKASKVG